ncbi:L2 [Felis catus papillomavirus type 5]|uniref:Minor capsid protein L2 n=1 Tax=Felis catus papillomavirus type 5 TaxID=2025339 RepID=A0A223FRE3_9PAPI|nr:L2 [Felis catus papillomavirus type 5]AST11852.1 L2 [Felis catus papillomavirus type 5]
MYPAKRRKRDTASNLYKHCLLGGDCVPDVVNKFEHKTPADKILQVGASVTYFGGLGIGTGKGTGGGTGYTPLGGGGGGVRVGGATRPLRPTIPIDPLGAVDINTGAVDIVPAVGEETSSIIPLEDVTGSNLPEVNVTGVVDTPASGGPSVSTTETETAILEVGPSGSGAPRQRISRQQYNNPLFTPLTQSTPNVGESTLGDSVLVGFSSGTTVGGEFEEIELQDFTGPRTSTPKENDSGGILQRAKELYHRRIKQVEVSEPAFLGRPGTLVEYGFENPAYDPDETLTFEVPESPRAAPHSDFQDIGVLGRVRYGLGQGGRLRVSRQAGRNTVRLRSGTRIGERVHFYTDLSSVRESIEMSVLGEQSGDLSVVLSEGDGTLVVSSSDVGRSEEELLLDELQEDFSGGQLTFVSERGQTTVVSLPSYENIDVSFVVPSDFSGGVIVSHAGEDEGEWSGSIPSWPVMPPIIFDPETSTFDLHPSLHRHRRKRRHIGL